MDNIIRIYKEYLPAVNPVTQDIYIEEFGKTQFWHLLTFSKLLAPEFLGEKSGLCWIKHCGIFLNHKKTAKSDINIRFSGFD